MLEAIRLRAQPKYLWSRRMYILKLQWIHPEWLRALVALLIAAPLYIATVSGFAMVFLLVPFIILVNYFGISWAMVIWFVAYGYLSYRLARILRRQQKNRPRRSRVMHSE